LYNIVHAIYVTDPDQYAIFGRRNRLDQEDIDSETINGLRVNWKRNATQDMFLCGLVPPSLKSRPH